ncbi:redoxin domain-containing protein [Conexibacter sp. W3-3-2]|nr:redoxin domain-containing protein [Conexibacter sp. W3-3-2]
MLADERQLRQRHVEHRCDDAGEAVERGVGSGGEQATALECGEPPRVVELLSCGTGHAGGGYFPQVSGPLDIHRVRVRAPELRSTGRWSGGGPLTLADLRGRVVLLDFWTSCCVNCLHVAEELRGLERRFADVLTTIAVHTPKFPHERDHGAVAAAAARLRLEHPVLEDPDGALWDAYGVRAWPTLVLIDPTGRVAATVAGEGHAVELAAAIEALVEEAREAGTLGPPGPLPSVRPSAAGRGELAFPGKVAIAPDGQRLVVADSGHDRVLVTTLDGVVLVELGGLYQPQGVRFDGPDALLVCETARDRVWRIELPGGTRTLLTEQVKSPWDVVRWQGHVVIAGAGRHVLCAIDAGGEAQVIAGTGAEELLDGPALRALLAQPSALAVTARDELAFLDAESSALRVLDRPAGTVRTLAGQGLFDWGASDGDRDRAMLQHPLGLAAAPDGSLFVADTYNHRLRVWRGEHLWTVPVEGFDEPGGLDVLPDGRLVVADTGAHRVVLVDPVAARAEAIDVGRPPSRDEPGAPVVAETAILAEDGVLHATLDVPLDGDALDPAGGPPVRVTARATDEALLPGERTWWLDALPARVAVPLGTGSGRITLELRAASCGPDACRLRRTERAYDVILTPAGG